MPPHHTIDTLSIALYVPRIMRVQSSATAAVGYAAAPPIGAIFAPRDQGPWLFGRSLDLAVFGGSAVLSFALLGLGAATGMLHGDVPPWLWLACIVAVDVAHVWSTMFRVYLDGREVRRRPLLYLGVPVLCYVIGAAAHAVSAMTFWRLLAYAAVFHFVRQQYGWVALYRRRAGERGRFDRVLDTAVIYAATVYPLIWWHGHLPRSFYWFMHNDFVTGLADAVARPLAYVYWGLLAAFLIRQGVLAATGHTINAGKVLVVLTTWACWYVGIIAFDSDYAFTVTNVLIHGIPYLALTYRYGRARAAQQPNSLLGRILNGGVAAFVFFCLVAAFAEEALWDQYIWHDNEHIFGEGVNFAGWMITLLVPFLALPQAVHYVLDGFIWKVRRGNPTLRKELSDS